MLVSAAGVRMEYRSRAGAVVALDDVTLSVRRHEFLSIVGPSGCGKTTLLLLAAGLLTPSAGEVRIDGRRLHGPCTDAAIVFQQHNLLEWRSVLDNVILPAEIRGLDLAPYRHRARELLALVGLAGFERAYPHELSGGMRQRTALCRALVHDLPLLLMDEPFAAADALAREEHRLMLQRLWLAQRRTVLFVTHDIQEAVMLSDRVAVMSPRPGRVLDVLEIDLPRPRGLGAAETAEFHGFVRHIRRLLGGAGLDGGARP